MGRCDAHQSPQIVIFGNECLEIFIIRLNAVQETTAQIGTSY